MRLTATAPLIVTERLELWLPQADDRDLLMTMMAPEAVRTYLGGMEPDAADTTARLLRNAGSWALHGYGTFMVRMRGKTDIVGNCGVFYSHRGLSDDFDARPEAGWILAETHFGLGIAYEAMTAALQWFDREHGPRDIVAMIAPGNTPSLALARKLGFAEMRMARVDGTGEDVRLFSRPGR